MKKRQLRPIWRMIIDIAETLGTLALIYALTVIVFLLG